MTFKTDLEEKLEGFMYEVDMDDEVDRIRSLIGKVQEYKHDILKLRLLRGIDLVDDLLEHALVECDEIIDAASRHIGGIAAAERYRVQGV